MKLCSVDTVGKDGLMTDTLVSLHPRINLSPFTKDFRVWGAPIETKSIYLRLPLGSFLTINQENDCFAVLKQQSINTHAIPTSLAIVRPAPVRGLGPVQPIRAKLLAG